MAVSYNVNDDLINGYITDLDSIITDLSNAKAAIGEEFPAEYQDFMQASVKKMYGTEEKVQQIEELSEAITKYKEWIQEVLIECHNGDDARAAQQQNPDISSSTEQGTSSPGNGNSSNSTPNSPEQKTVSTDGLTGPSSTRNITAPEYTSAVGAVGNGNTGSSSVSGGGTNGIGNNGNGNNNGSTVNGGGNSGSGYNGGNILNPFGKDNNYGTSGHSMGGNLANSINGRSSNGNGLSGGSNSYGLGLAGSANGAGLSGDGNAHGVGLNGGANGAGLNGGKNGKGLLDNFSELSSGTSLGNMIGNGIGSGSIFSLKNGTPGNGNFGTIAKAGIALGLAGAGAGIATAVHEKYYVFDQEDWLALIPSYRSNILRKYSEVKMSNEQIELFEKSTFKIKSSILDDPAKQLEKVIKDVPDIRQELLQKYSIDIFNSKGKVDRYLLFILMIIDGQSTISEYNYVTLISDYVDEINPAYGGLQMEDYIYDFEEENAVREEIEGY